MTGSFRSDAFSYKTKTMDTVQEIETCRDMPSSKAFGSYSIQVEVFWAARWCNVVVDWYPIATLHDVTTQKTMT